MKFGGDESSSTASRRNHRATSPRRNISDLCMCINWLSPEYVAHRGPLLVKQMAQESIATSYGIAVAWPMGDFGCAQDSVLNLGFGPGVTESSVGRNKNRPKPPCFLPSAFSVAFCSTISSNFICGTHCCPYCCCRCVSKYHDPSGAGYASPQAAKSCTSRSMAGIWSVARGYTVAGRQCKAARSW